MLANRLSENGTFSVLVIVAGVRSAFIVSAFPIITLSNGEVLLATRVLSLLKSRSSHLPSPPSTRSPGTSLRRTRLASMVALWSTFEANCLVEAVQLVSFQSVLPCSTIHLHRPDFMVYTRGSDDEYNRLANLTEDESWNWTNIEPFYLKVCRLAPSI